MKTCIITGAGSGIGKQTAIQIGNLGEFECIVLVGRNSEALIETKISMSSHVDVKIEIADFNNPEVITDTVKNIYDYTGSIDCLLNIAGYTDPQPLLSTSLENLRQTYNVNVFSVLMMIRETVKYMKRSGGKILNVASTAGLTPRPGWLSYSSSKAAVISMSKTLTEELAEYKIKVYCVSPGRCATKLRARLAPNEDPSTIMQPSEVANIIVNLISKDEQCLDGQNIIIRKQLN